jgi:hypothetical protein
MGNAQMRRLSLLLALNVLTASVGAQDAPSALRAAVQDYVEKHGEHQAPPFRYALTDLNGDGRDDAIVLLLGTSWCGSGGCNMLVFRGTKDGFTLVSGSTVTSAPIRVSSEKAQGWKTLIVYAKGRGDVLMRFNGTRYPSNPSSQPIATPAQVGAAQIVVR